MHDLFRNVLKSFQIGNEELAIIKVQLEEQMAGFFKSEMEQDRLLKFQLAEIRKKSESIEERFAIGEIDGTMYNKFKSKYTKESFEIEQDLKKIGGYSSNLEKVIKFAIEMCQNPSKIWDSADLDGKRTFQNLLFPEGIYYDREMDRVRTTTINVFFSIIPELTGVLRGQKKGDFIKNEKIPALVIPTGII